MVSSISTNGQGPSEDGTSFLQGGPRSKTHPISGLLDRRGDYASANAHAEIIHLTCNGARRPGQEFFSLIVILFGHTYSSVHEPSSSLLLPFICVTLTCSACFRPSTQCSPPNISSVTINHDELFELLLFREAGSLNHSAPATVSHHTLCLASPHRHHRFSAASVHDDRTRFRQSDPAT
jgi:hypothetical protein